MDSDGSGNVEVGELGSQLAAMGYELSPEQVNAFIADIDRDSDGQVSAMEFLTALHDCMRAAAVSGCFKDAKAWKFDNPRKFSFLTKVRPPRPRPSYAAVAAPPNITRLFALLWPPP